MTTAASSQLGDLLVALDGLRSTLIAGLGAPDTLRAESSSAAGTGDATPLVSLMVAARSAVLANPSLARGTVSALARLGRSHAATPEGAVLLERLAGAPEVAQLRALWEAVTLNVLDDIDEESPVPAAWLEVILDTLAGPDAGHGVADHGLADAIAAVRPEGFA